MHFKTAQLCKAAFELEEWEFNTLSTALGILNPQSRAGTNHQVNSCLACGLRRGKKPILGRSPGGNSISVNPTFLPGMRVSALEEDGAIGGSSHCCSNFEDIKGLCEDVVPREPCFCSANGNTQLLKLKGRVNVFLLGFGHYIVLN